MKKDIMAKNKKIYMFDRYKIQKEMGEDKNWEYKIVSTSSLEVEEVYDSLEEAEEALKFWNQ